MFSSKFLSGANPLNAMSSAVNKFGLFGDDGEGDKKSSQQGKKPSGEQQTGVAHAKDAQQEQGPTKSGQGPSMQKSQPPSKQSSPQLQGNRQTGQQQATSSRATENPQTQSKGTPQQGSPKPGAHQVAKSGAQPESPKVPPGRQQIPPKAKVQQDPAQGSKKVGSESETQQQQSPKTGQQKQDTTKAGQQQKGTRATPQLQSSDKQHGTPDLTPAGSPSAGATRARSQSKAVPKTLCPVCNTAELNINAKEPPNYKTCTQCKLEVCSLCGFSPPDSDVSTESQFIFVFVCLCANQTDRYLFNTILHSRYCLI